MTSNYKAYWVYFTGLFAGRNWDHTGFAYDSKEEAEAAIEKWIAVCPMYNTVTRGY